MVKSKTIVMDLDDTICFPNLEHKESEIRYGQAKPNQPIIDHMKKLSEEGWEFVISTARRMVTHKGDVQKIIDDVGTLTENWLKKHDVPYSYIQWGKPYAAYYVDDKAMSLKDFLNVQ